MNGTQKLLAGLAFVLAAFVSSTAGAWVDVPDSAQDSDVKHRGQERIETRLITDVRQVAPGESFRVGVAFSMDPDWHIYWENPGDSGVPTDITWEAENLQFGPLRWSAPTSFEESDGNITVFGYEGRTVLFSKVSVPKDVSNDISIRAKVDYLACSDVCMPGQSRLERTIPVGETTKQAKTTSLKAMDRYASRVPRPASNLGVETSATFDPVPKTKDETYRALLEVIQCGSESKECQPWQLQAPNNQEVLIPDGASGLTPTVEAVYRHPDAESGWLIELSGRLENTDDTKEQLSGIIKFSDSNGELIPAYIKHPLPKSSGGSDIGPLLSEAKKKGQRLERLATSQNKQSMTIWFALVMAFFGGMILNLMPCVFPVLAFKVTSFAKIARKSQRHILSHGAAYTAGIVGTLMLLALAVISLQAAGVTVGWGFQFQHPAFSAVLSGLLLAFALNLFGVFEVTFQPGTLSKKVDNYRGLPRSFGEGILAVLLATPCSAPFLGTAVGFAFASGPLTIMSIFVTLGLGLAAPFVALAMVPGWSDILPKPGAWMKYLKEFLGFALLGTVIWLVWIVGQQTGPTGMAKVLVFAGAIGFGLWLYGAVQHGYSSKIKWGFTTVGVAAVVGASLVTFPLQSSTAGSIQSNKSGNGPITWEKWSPETVRKEVSNGNPVFVDFTADWCLTCKVNERNAIQTKAVAEAAQKHGVTMLKADWTNRSEQIRQALAKHGKAAVPTYVVYKPNQHASPTQLPELLTQQILVDAFAEAAASSQESS
jgi:thiol:disulfide interchange protein DsbD